MLAIDIDQDRLKRDISELAQECATLKRLLRTTWVRPMAEEQKQLCLARRRATELHVLLARARGKIHIAHAPRDHAGVWDREAHAVAIAERAMVRYLPQRSEATPP